MINELIVDVFREITDNMNKDCNLISGLKSIDDTIDKIYYHHGHYQEIANTLTEMNNMRSVTNKYPMIALFEDIDYDVRNMIYTPRVNLVVCYRTRDTYRAKDRYLEIIKPILLPVYESLMDNIKVSGYFNAYDFPHRMIPRPFYGAGVTSDGGTKVNRANIFNDHVDAIEIRSLVLPLYDYNCSKPFINNCK